MRFISFALKGRSGLAVLTQDNSYRGLTREDREFPGSLQELLEQGDVAVRNAAVVLGKGPELPTDEIEFLPPIQAPGKIICIGLNYADHTAETGFEPPKHPTVFARYANSLVGHRAPIVRPTVSDHLDYEGEIVAVVGRAGRHIRRDSALAHIAGYSIFNDASIRDYQMRTTQWTVGKSFDATGAFGPQFVTAEELPPGCKGLSVETRLNGQVVQRASTDALIFDVATLVSMLSESMTLAPGDIIVTGTPAGVGMARKPPLWMKPGDVCEVEVERLGILRNPISAEA